VTPTSGKRDELARDLSDHQKRLALGDPLLTLQKIEQFGLLLRDRLHNGPRSSVRPMPVCCCKEVAVTGQEVRINGSKVVLARCASTDLGDAASGIPSFTWDWRTVGDKTENWQILLSY
jgi:hypothetical protein